MGCIYMWTNQVNQKRYIGKCHVDVMTRYNAHINGQGNQPLKKAIDKYGIENFTFEILHDGILDIFLDDYEKEAIREYNTKTPHGYNLTDGGEGTLNPTEETLRKRAEKLKGIPRPQEVRAKISASHIGIRPNAETRAKLSAAKKGKPSNMKGRKHTVQSKAQMSAARKGKPMPKETREKISNTLSGVPKNPYSESAKDFFLSLPDCMDVSEKRKLLHEEYSGLVEKSVIYYWVRKWGDHPSKPKNHPDKPEARKHFLSLPLTLSLTERRNIVLEKFPNLNKETLRKWSYQWQSEM